MILPDYVPDIVYTHSFDDEFKEEVELLIDEVRKEIKKEKEEMKKEIEKEKKERKKEIEKIMDMIKRISDEEDSSHTLSPRKRQTCSLIEDADILEPPVKKSKAHSDNEDK